VAKAALASAAITPQIEEILILNRPIDEERLDKNRKELLEIGEIQLPLYQPANTPTMMTWEKEISVIISPTGTHPMRSIPRHWVPAGYCIQCGVS
jgi:hypothetical protein